MKASSSFHLEIDLVDSFTSALREAGAPWMNLLTALEFDYQRGRTDVIALDRLDQIFAFEAKLTKWRDALQQAYRNTCFAHRSYVLLPEQAAQIAARHLGEFARRKVGLCSVSNDGTIVVVYEAPENRPIMPWLSRKAKERITSNSDLDEPRTNSAGNL